MGAHHGNDKGTREVKLLFGAQAMSHKKLVMQTSHSLESLPVN